MDFKEHLDKNFYRDENGIYRKKKPQKVEVDASKVKAKRNIKLGKKSYDVEIPVEMEVQFIRFSNVDYTLLTGNKEVFETAIFKVCNLRAVPAQRLNHQTTKLLYIDDEKLKLNSRSKKAAIQRYLNLKGYMAWAYKEMQGMLLERGYVFKPLCPYIRFHAGNKMPASWTKRTKALELNQLRKRKPDWDNEAKALQDGLFDEDEFIGIGILEKTWAEEDFVMIEMPVVLSKDFGKC